MSISKQDKELAKAAVALYRATEFGCVPANRDTDEELAKDCVKYAADWMEMFHYCAADDSQAIADYVFSDLGLDHSKFV